MAHQPGWMELYVALDKGEKYPHPKLVKKCKSSRDGCGETMLHWYALEGQPHVLEALIKLGFEVNVTNEFGDTPLMDAAYIQRWDNVRVLLQYGADKTPQNHLEETYFDIIDCCGSAVSEDLRENR
jgi:ankyrin repeat protein